MVLYNNLDEEKDIDRVILQGVQSYSGIYCLVVSADGSKSNQCRNTNLEMDLLLCARHIILGKANKE